MRMSLTRTSGISWSKHGQTGWASKTNTDNASLVHLLLERVFSRTLNCPGTVMGLCLETLGAQKGGLDGCGQGGLIMHYIYKMFIPNLRATL